MMPSQPATVPLAHDVVGRGDPVLLLAGTGYPGATWPASLVDGLAADHAVIRLDYRGVGDTPGTDGPYSTRLFAADAAALVRTLGLGPAHVVGHSMGGRVAQWLALDAPDLVRSLTLAASGPGAVDSAAPQERLPLEAMATLVELGYRGFMERQISTTFFTPEFLERHPEVVIGLVDAYWDHRPSIRDYLKHVAARQEHRTADRLAEIRQPALVLVGDRDTHAGGTGSHLEQSRYLAGHLPDARLELIPGTKHGYFWEAPEVSLGRLRAFLATI